MGTDEQIAIGQVALSSNVEILTLDARRPSGVIQFGQELGSIVLSQRIRNRVPASGRKIVRDLLGRGILGAGAGFAPTHIALGTGTTAPLDTDWHLEGEVYRDIITTRQGFTDKMTYQLFLAAGDGNGNTFSEAGLFDNPIAGDGFMLARAVFTPIPKTDSIQLVITWDINISSS